MDRKSLRKKVTEVLKAANIPYIGEDVYSQRSVPSEKDTLPIILVYSKSESIEEFDNSPKSYRKDIDIVFEIVSVADDDEELADGLDDIVLGVEKAIEEDLFLEENCESVQLKSIFTTTESNGSNPIGVTRVQYTFTLITPARSEPELPDLNTMANNFVLNDNQI